MRKLLIFLLPIVLAASPAFGQSDNGNIAIFADNSGTLPCFPTVGTGVLYLYVLHVNAIGATASQFAVPEPWCLQGQFLSCSTPFGICWDCCFWPPRSVVVGYNTCKTGTFLILTIMYQVTAVPPSCCCYDVVPDPNLVSGRIEVADCDYNMSYATGGRTIINPTADCPCGGSGGCLLPTPADESTWGRVKALYSD